MPLLVIAALATACSPSTPKNTPTAAPTQYPQGPRLAEFVYKSSEEPTVQGRMDSVDLRQPNVGVSEVHVVVEYSPTLAFIPAQGPESWLTAVATIPDGTTQPLAGGEITNTLLPSMYPHLYEYVPQKCKFATISLEFADKTLAPDKSSTPGDFGPMDMEALAMFEDYHLLIFAALGHSWTPGTSYSPSPPHPDLVHFRGRSERMRRRSHHRAEKRKLTLN